MKIGCLAVLVISSVACAAQLDIMSADPDAPATELGWRSAVRGKAGVRIPFIAPAPASKGFRFDLPLFIELHNYSGQTGFIPFQLWRGRIALEAGYELPFDAAKEWWFGATVGLEHESDHPTGAPVSGYDAAGFLNINDVAVTASFHHRTRRSTWLAATNRLHVLTCTFNQYVCGAQGGAGGDRGYEFAASVIQQWPLDDEARWVLVLAAHGAGRLPTPQIAGEGRITVRAGISRQINSHWLALSLILLAGNEVGMERNGPGGVRGGLTLAWSP